MRGEHVKRHKPVPRPLGVTEHVERCADCGKLKSEWSGRKEECIGNMKLN